MFMSNCEVKKLMLLTQTIMYVAQLLSLEEFVSSEKEAKTRLSNHKDYIPLYFVI